MPNIHELLDETKKNADTLVLEIEKLRSVRIISEEMNITLLDTCKILEKPLSRSVLHRKTLTPYADFCNRIFLTKHCYVFSHAIFSFKEIIHL